MARMRVDRLLVARGLVPSRTQAQEAIEGGRVFSAGRAIARAAEALPKDAPLEVRPPVHPYVSRGGVKLAFALDHFGIDPDGAVVLDLGASTGGFTDVLLRRGVRRVYAVDVGHGQLAPEIRNDPRVVALEGVNARYLTSADIPDPMDLVVCDVSFISLTLVLPPALDLVRPGSCLVALIKPQFEVGPGGVGKGGIVRDPALRNAARGKIADWLAAWPGWTVEGMVESPIAGGDGNREFLLAARRA